jgi:hypothetical protein
LEVGFQPIELQGEDGNVDIAGNMLPKPVVVVDVSMLLASSKEGDAVEPTMTLEKGVLAPGVTQTAPVLSAAN